MKRMVSITLSALALAGCAAAAEPDWVRDVGFLFSAQWGRDPVEAPSTARSGVPFTVTITTAGPSGCIHPSGAVVTVAGLTVEIVPMDEHYVGRTGGCPGDIAPYPRDVSVTVRGAGVVTLRVKGRGDADPAQFTVVERQIQLEP